MFLIAQLGLTDCAGLLKVCQDRNSSEGVLETTEASVLETEAFIQHVRGREGGEAGRLLPVITPRFLPTCSLELLSSKEPKYFTQCTIIFTRICSHCLKLIDMAAMWRLW
jgi:hypothetical protein